MKNREKPGNRHFTLTSSGSSSEFISSFSFFTHLLHSQYFSNFLLSPQQRNRFSKYCLAYSIYPYTVHGDMSKPAGQRSVFFLLLFTHLTFHTILALNLLHTLLTEVHNTHTCSTSNSDELLHWTALTCSSTDANTSLFLHSLFSAGVMCLWHASPICSNSTDVGGGLSCTAIHSCKYAQEGETERESEREREREREEGERHSQSMAKCFLRQGRQLTTF